mmetsp:Transcript_6005/g.10722  ORF Transcript_6005/g.10722 Transcript_6005/m.10722 type:complete len:244 (+) Transcript_6005:117-848(+)|eukprot:CAMPEP_0202013592 /NCGR_PEP_ID=MMETSP0905-20130828/26699_1 /ASSEMBLY_ACC=CAM_ASM_000554 /TAXON_ID=420261 /ORGANISM="Thalassiosira antarctica, Strain CCMP982" /LENGTH=243 /DNA_ID=CAMNT_0048573211 /DNA_START=98 /DNA_END=829 /DNA_ORIENTATION=-
MHSLESTREAPGDGREFYEDSAAMDNNERPDSTASNNTCEEDIQQTNDGMGDTAALLVMLYLLFISTLLVGAVAMGFLVVVKYGVVVLVAVSVVVFAMSIVAATLTSVITRDTKLRKARSKIKSWHVACKDEILKEIENFRDDFAAYTSDTLLLTYGNDGVDKGGTRPDFEETITDLDNKDSSHQATTSKEEHKPKSLIFRSLVFPFTNKSTKKWPNSQIKQKRPWKRKKKNTCELYEPPNLV